MPLYEKEMVSVSAPREKEVENM